MIPFRLDESIVRFMVDIVRPRPRRVAYRLRRRRRRRLSATSALRGDDAWIGGVGVIPSARRQGIGETLMRALHDEARERGVANVWLEVIDRNEGALRPLREARLPRRREVEVWSLDGERARRHSRRPVPSSAHARVRELRDGREPWQRADADARRTSTDLRGRRYGRRRRRLPRHGPRPAAADRRRQRAKTSSHAARSRRGERAQPA